MSIIIQRREIVVHRFSALMTKHRHETFSDYMGIDVIIFITVAQPMFDRLGSLVSIGISDRK